MPPQDKVSLYRGEQTIQVTPEEAIKWQGGTTEDPFKALKFSGWTQGTPPPPKDEKTDIDRPVVEDSEESVDPGSSYLKEAQDKYMDAPTFDYDAPDQDKILQEELRRAQSMIDATQGMYLEEMARIKREGERGLAEAGSMAVGAGLAGSPFKGQMEEPVREATRRQESAATAKRQAQIAQIMAAAYKQSTSRFQSDRDFFGKQQDRFKEERDDYLDHLKAQQEGARAAIKDMAAGGYSLDELSKEDYRELLKMSGYSDFQAKSIYAQGTPEANATYSYKDGMIIGTYFDPVTQKPVVTTEQIDVEGEGGAEVKITSQGIFVIPEGATSVEDIEYKAFGTDKPDTYSYKGKLYERNPETGEYELKVNVPTPAPKPKAKTYYTQPEADGTVKYYFGQKGKPEDSIELDSKQYLEATSKAEGVLDDKDEDIKKIDADWLRKYLYAQYSEDDIQDFAKQAGQASAWTDDLTDIDNYIKWLNNQAEFLRESGYTEKEIKKELDL